ncbi:hypothetical protein [Nocardia brasiliensis]
MRTRISTYGGGLMLAVLSASAVFAAPAVATDSGVDMQKACDTQQRMPLIAKPLDPNNARSWRCTATLVSKAIDVARACRDQYSPQAVAIVLDERNAYSWRCRR